MSLQESIILLTILQSNPSPYLALSSLPPSNFKCIKAAANLSSGALEIYLFPQHICQFGSNRLSQKFSAELGVSYVNMGVLTFIC